MTKDKLLALYLILKKAHIVDRLSEAKDFCNEKVDVILKSKYPKEIFDLLTDIDFITLSERTQKQIIEDINDAPSADAAHYASGVAINEDVVKRPDLIASIVYLVTQSKYPIYSFDIAIDSNVLASSKVEELLSLIAHAKSSDNANYACRMVIMSCDNKNIVSFVRMLCISKYPAIVFSLLHNCIDDIEYDTLTEIINYIEMAFSEEHARETYIACSSREVIKKGYSLAVARIISKSKYPIQSKKIARNEVVINSGYLLDVLDLLNDGSIRNSKIADAIVSCASSYALVNNLYFMGVLRLVANAKEVMHLKYLTYLANCSAFLQEEDAYDILSYIAEMGLIKFRYFTHYNNENLLHDIYEKDNNDLVLYLREFIRLCKTGSKKDLDKLYSDTTARIYNAKNDIEEEQDEQYTDDFWTLYGLSPEEAVRRLKEINGNPEIDDDFSLGKSK